MKIDRRLARQEAKKEFKKLNKKNKIPKAKRLPFSAVYKVMTSALNKEDMLGINRNDTIAETMADDLSDMIDGSSDEIINS